MEWKDIQRFNRKFAVSRCGKIRNNLTGKILKSSNAGSGYPHVTVKPDGRKGKTYGIRIHREVAIAFVPLVEGKDFVNHIDGVKTNNNYTNLEWVTKSENSIHAVEHGLLPTLFESGEGHPQVKLSTEEVKLIRQIYKPRDSTYGARALARTYNVDHSTIVKIANGSERLSG